MKIWLHVTAKVLQPEASVTSVTLVMFFASNQPAEGAAVPSLHLEVDRQITARV